MKTRHARSLRLIIEQVRDLRRYQDRNPEEPLRHLIYLIEWPLSKRERRTFREILRRTRR